MYCIQRFLWVGRRQMVFTAGGVVLALPAMASAGSVFTGVGAAGSYAIFDYGANSSADLELVTGEVEGSVGAAHGCAGHQDIQFTVLNANVDVSTETGATYTDYANNNSNVINGALHTGVNLSAAVTAVQNAYTNDASLTATQTISQAQLYSAVSVNGTAGLNVIDLNGEMYHNLTLNGPASSTWVVNITGGIQLGGSDGIVTTGGVHTNNVIVDYESTQQLVFNSSGVIDGNIIDPSASAQLIGGTLNGCAYFGGNQTVYFQNMLITAPTPSILGSVLVIVGGLGGMGWLYETVRRRRGVNARFASERA